MRASTDRSRDRIREAVESVVRERLEEGEFNECDLSLHDLRRVADSYVASLSAVYHPRVEYPEPTRRELAARSGTPLPARAPSAGAPAAGAAPVIEAAPPPLGGERPIDEDQ